MKIIFENSLFEGTKYDKKAAKIISDSGLFNEEISNNIIQALFREDIHAFVHSPAWLEKYLQGIARMLVEESDGNQQKAKEFLEECPSVFDEYLTWVKDNRDKVGSAILDDKFINKMSYQDVKDDLDKIQSERDKESKDELSKMKFSQSNFSLVPIDSYNEMHSKYGGRATGDGSSDKYAGGGGTAWCHTNSKSTYDAWVKDGNKFFVLQNNDWKDIPFNKESNAKDPKDAYGNSLIAILVDKYGRLKKATLRCNHVGVNSNADNQYDTYAELSKVVGFNVEDAVKDKMGDIPEYNPLNIEDGVLVKCDNGVEGKVIIPDGVTSIGDNAFRDCSSLTSITIPDSVTSISWNAFFDCSSLTSITIPNSVMYIGYQAFYGCDSLTSITIPDGVTSIGDNAFRDCSSLTSITIPDGVTSIGDNAFRDCSSLTSITIPDGVTSIDSRAFQGCTRLTSITIPDSVTSISWNAFFDCSSLTSITIPNSVMYIGYQAFYGCDSLIDVYYQGTKDQYLDIDRREGNENISIKSGHVHFINEESYSRVRSEGMKIIFEEGDFDEYKDDTPDYSIVDKGGYFVLLDPDGRVIKDDFLSYEEAEDYVESNKGLPVEDEVVDNSEYIVYRHYEGKDGYPCRDFSLSDIDPFKVNRVRDDNWHLYDNIKVKTYNDLQDATNISNKFNRLMKYKPDNKFRWRVEKKWW